MSNFLKEYLSIVKQTPEKKSAVRHLKVDLVRSEKSDCVRLESLKAARRLSRLFVTIKGDLYGRGRWIVHKQDTSSFTCFIKLAERFQEYYERYKIRVNEVDFLQAQFFYWKKQTFPARLLADNVFEVYKAYQCNVRQVIFKPNEEQLTRLDEEQVGYLSNIRGERFEDVVEMLRRSEHFTGTFLRRWA